MTSLAELRLRIDDLDRRIVALLAERTQVVRTLTEGKRDEAAVRSPDRVAAVLARVRALAEEHGMPPGIAEATYRTLIAELTEMQMVRLAERRSEAADAGGAVGPADATTGGLAVAGSSGAADAVGSADAMTGGSAVGVEVATVVARPGLL